MIRKSPIILKKWTMNTRLCKDELTYIPVWVKIHDVPIQVFSEDGLSIIASQIGVPLIEGSGFTIESVNIEYEWKPPCCDPCKIFGHVHDHCPKKVLIPTTIVTLSVPTPSVEKTNDGFQTVGKKKKKGKSKSTNVGQIGGHSYSSFALEELSLDHLETKLYD
ncbi:zinc knuckle CX2CX4HX4C containing protein [Tanacetum coccineum]